MSFTSWLGSIFAPGAAQNVADQKGALQSMLAPGSSYNTSGDLGLATQGTQGNALVNAAAQLGGNNVSANFKPIEQDQDALAQLGAAYYQQFLHGGKAEAAAKNRAVSSSADAGGGGLAGVKALQQAAQQLSGQAEQTSLQERGNSGEQANANSLQASMLAIRETALKAAITHANIQKNLAAQNAINSLTNAQTQNNLRLQQGAIAGQHSLNSQDIAYQKAQSDIAQGVVGAGLSAASQIGGTAANAFGTSSVDVPQLSETEIQNAANNTLAKYNVDPSELTTSVPSYGVTGQAAAIANQNALEKALGTQSSKITYPTLQSDASQYLTDPSTYPLTTSVRS